MSSKLRTYHAVLVGLDTAHFHMQRLQASTDFRVVSMAGKRIIRAEVRGARGDLPQVSLPALRREMLLRARSLGIRDPSIAIGTADQIQCAIIAEKAVALGKLKISIWNATSGSEGDISLDVPDTNHEVVDQCLNSYAALGIQSLASAAGMTIVGEIVLE